MPKFETIAEGFTSLKMVPRTEIKEKEPSPPTAQTQTTNKYTWDQSQFEFTQNAKETFEIGILHQHIFELYNIIQFFVVLSNFIF